MGGAEDTLSGEEHLRGDAVDGIAAVADDAGEIGAYIGVYQEHDGHDHQRLTDRAPAGLQHQQNQNGAEDDIQLRGITAALGQGIQRCDDIHIDSHSRKGHDPVVNGHLVRVVLFKLKADKAQEQAKGEGGHTLDHGGEQAEHSGIDLENSPQDADYGDHSLNAGRKMFQAVAGLNLKLVEVHIHDLVFFLFKDTHDLPPIFSLRAAREGQTDTYRYTQIKASGKHSEK